MIMTDNTPNFISTFDNVLSIEECKQIIYEFEDSKEKQIEGKVGNDKIKIGTKKSTDITYSFRDNSLTTEIIGKSLRKYINLYTNEYPELNRNVSSWSTYDYYNVQRYKPQEGYFKPHCEVVDIKSSSRILVWMFYLNSLENGGTLFPRYEIGIKAIQGRLVIWPAYWTHIHKGQISQTQTKYITTGWYNLTI